MEPAKGMRRVRGQDVARTHRGPENTSRVYAFRKIVHELLIPAGVVDMAALASRGGGPRFLHAMWTLYEHC